MLKNQYNLNIIDNKDMENKRPLEWKVVGISGATCSGKSSLAEYLISQYSGSVLIQQDQFFLDKYSDHHIIIPELNHQNWECLQSIDWESLIAKVKEELEKEPPCENSLFFIEGHIIYNYPELEKLFDKKYFLTLTEKECFRRRSGRVYDPPDCSGYFEKCIWPMYLSNLEDVKNNCLSVVYVDGTQSITNIFEYILTDLKNSMPVETNN